MAASDQDKVLRTSGPRSWAPIEPAEAPETTSSVNIGANAPDCC